MITPKSYDRFREWLDERIAEVETLDIRDGKGQRTQYIEGYDEGLRAGYIDVRGYFTGE